MREQDRLRALQMGVARENDLFMSCPATHQRSLKGTDSASAWVLSSEQNSRRVSATWSFLLRAVCSFAPVGPIFFVNADSMFICTSSSSLLHSNRPSSISIPDLLESNLNFSNLSESQKACPPSAAACTSDPLIS